jgi:ATP-dependent DNA helicase RecG
MRVGDKGLKLTFDERVQARPQVNGEEEVSTACVLLFGKYPQKFFPRARTRFIRYEGVDEKVGAEMNVIKDVTFEGTILNQVKKTIEFIETQVREHTFLGQHAQFVTKRDYPEFVIQEMTVNACCHRAYNIKGTETQIKMFDDRLVFESPGKLPGQVKPNNIRHTHFSRNPKIAAFLKAYHYVKEFGEGFDRICREQEANGANVPSFRTDEFILKITVPKVTENNRKLTEKLPENAKGLTENREKLIEKLIEKASINGDRLTENRIAILRFMADDPYISKSDLSKLVGISIAAISSNIEIMRGKYLRRVGPDKGGFWEIIE